MSIDQLYWVTLGACALGFLAALHPRLAAPAGFAIAGALIYVTAFHFWDLTVDDAYISYRYAYNFAHGNGLVYNSGEHVEGYTNFSWVLLLALTERIGAGIVTPSRWLGYAADLGTLGVMWLLARRLVPESRVAADRVFAGAAVAFAALPATGYWATAGLEEPLFTCVVLLALYRAIVENDGPGRLPLSALIALAAALTRPEGVLVVAVIFAGKGVAAMRGRDVSRLRALATWCAIIAVPYAAYIGWRWSYYGYPLPNTYYQKVGGGPTVDWERYGEGLHYVRGFWMQTGAVLIFPLPLLSLFGGDRRAAAAPLAAFALVWALYVVYVGGDFMSFHRFMLPVVPIALLLAVDSLMSVADYVNRERTLPRPRVFAVIGGVLVMAWVCVVPLREQQLLSFRRSTRVMGAEIAAWLNEQDRGAYVAVGAAGYIPFETRMTTLDPLGLTDEHIAHGPRLSDAYDVQGHRKGDGAYVIRRAPDIVIVTASVGVLPRSGIDWRRSLATQQLLAADESLMRQPDFYEKYESAWVKLPSGRFFSFFRKIGTDKIQANRAEYQ